MKLTNFITRIKGFPQPYFRLVDLEKIFAESRVTLAKSIERLVAAGVLVRLQKDVYVLRDQELNMSLIANRIYQPSYLSLESVLYQSGVINQPPLGYTFVTSRVSHRLILGGVECEFVRLKPQLWWGYGLVVEVYQAELEKAVVDMWYLKGRGQRRFEVDEWYVSKINKVKLEQYLDRAGLDRSLMGLLG